jgi:hypothetical protein
MCTPAHRRSCASQISYRLALGVELGLLLGHDLGLVLVHTVFRVTISATDSSEAITKRKAVPTKKATLGNEMGAALVFRVTLG